MPKEEPKKASFGRETEDSEEDKDGAFAQKHRRDDASTIVEPTSTSTSTSTDPVPADSKTTTT